MSLVRFRGTTDVKSSEEVYPQICRFEGVAGGQGTTAALTFTTQPLANKTYIQGSNFNTFTVTAPSGSCIVWIQAGLSGGALAGTTNFELQEGTTPIASTYANTNTSTNHVMSVCRFLPAGFTTTYKIVATVGGAGTFVQDASHSFFQVYLMQ